ncbi:hypothetical protein LCGC14_1659390 [marine sediment metagenome]|uniref:Uncharacterized protein n=1 Tax=marine sediment metagenome TaxID=412755 RepID=A0A0F9KUS9_9ZZZZ
MTDRVNGFTVTLAESIRDDDAAAIREAILQLRHVIDVAPIVDHPDAWTAAVQERVRMREAILGVLDERLKL